MFSYTLNPINKWKRKVRELEKEVDFLVEQNANLRSKFEKVETDANQYLKLAAEFRKELASLRDAYMKHAVRKGFRTTPDSKFDERMERVKGVLGEE